MSSLLAPIKHYLRLERRLWTSPPRGTKWLQTESLSRRRVRAPSRAKSRECRQQLESAQIDEPELRQAGKPPKQRKPAEKKLPTVGLNSWRLSTLLKRSDFSRQNKPRSSPRSGAVDTGHVFNSCCPINRRTQRPQRMSVLIGNVLRRSKIFIAVPEKIAG
jgi:hypothetical protein